MGSTTHIVDEDGLVLNHYTYDAWGNLTAQEEAVPNRFKFTGQQLDPVTQQYYLRARFYNPVIARFTQEDTYRGDGLNLYAYCQNNPVFYTDPSGNVCPEGTKDPLLRAPVPSPNQQQSTALVPYNPDFAAKQNALYGNGYANANQSLPNQSADTPLLDANSQVNQPVKPSAEALTPDINKSELFLPDEYYQKLNQNLTNAINARDAEVSRIQSLSKTQQSKVATVVAGVDLRTGEVFVGVKNSSVYKGQATCAEDIVFRGLGGNELSNIIMTPAVRPRTGEIIPVCTRCQINYPINQFIKGTTFQ